MYYNYIKVRSAVGYPAPRFSSPNSLDGARARPRARRGQWRSQPRNPSLGAASTTDHRVVDTPACCAARPFVPLTNARRG